MSFAVQSQGQRIIVWNSSHNNNPFAIGYLQAIAKEGGPVADRSLSQHLAVLLSPWRKASSGHPSFRPFTLRKVGCKNLVLGPYFSSQCTIQGSATIPIHFWALPFQNPEVSPLLHLGDLSFPIERAQTHILPRYPLVISADSRTA